MAILVLANARLREFFGGSTSAKDALMRCSCMGEKVEFAGESCVPDAPEMLTINLPQYFENCQDLTKEPCARLAPENKAVFLPNLMHLHLLLQIQNHKQDRLAEMRAFECKLRYGEY